MSKLSNTNYLKVFEVSVFQFISFSIFLKYLKFGDYNGGVHLFPFRTEKLSPLVLMVLRLAGE